jgi:CheY-like chemotaxis protein
MQFQQHRILCVDDEIVGTTLRAEVLRQQGYSVDLYHSPVAALSCDISMFELAILDFEMPELNGRELLLRLRALGARFPTVLLTGRLEALLHEDRVLFARCLDKGMPTLIRNVDRKELGRLIDSLRKDFNGDFLGDDRHDPWSRLNESGFGLLDSFLKRTELSTGQQSFWNYDFSFLPVELLYGLYETFLSTEEQAKHGAYYTPRNLAMLAVDQAFLTSTNPLEETIFDGACGSGILLTTAYRRLIALSEAKERRQLGFRERRELLLAQIFGADINVMACRVTAFSLYLSLPEG